MIFSMIELESLFISESCCEKPFPDTLQEIQDLKADLARAERVTLRDYRDDLKVKGDCCDKRPLSQR